MNPLVTSATGRHNTKQNIESDQNIQIQTTNLVITETSHLGHLLYRDVYKRQIDNRNVNGIQWQTKVCWGEGKLKMITG